MEILKDPKVLVRIADSHDKGLDTLTAGVVRKAFATWAQGWLPWAMSRSSNTVRVIKITKLLLKPRE